MLRSTLIQRFGRTGTASVLATVLAASAAEAALPTGGMMLPRPHGPARCDLPAPTAISTFRIPSATAYGLVGTTTPSKEMGDIFSPEPKEEESAVMASNHPLIQPRNATTPNPFESFEAEPATMTANGVTEATVVERLPETWLDEQPSETSSEATFAGLKGICPVTLIEERRVVTPQPGLTTEFQGRSYSFATPQAKAAFEADPEKYAPAFGGRDVVLTAAGAIEAVGSLKHAGFYRERLYLFQSEDTCKAFYNAPRRFALED